MAQTAVSSGFTYQGRLNLSGQPVDGSADLQFSLFDAATLGNPVGPTQTVLNANVVDGLFTTQLDFGVDAFKSRRARHMSRQDAPFSRERGSQHMPSTSVKASSRGWCAAAAKPGRMRRAR